MSYSIDLRERVIKFVKEGGSKADAARTYQVARGTVYQWLSRKTLAPHHHGPRSRKLIKADALKLIAECSDARLVDYAEKLGVSHVAVWRAFKRWGITKKNDPVRGKEIYTTDTISQKSET